MIGIFESSNDYGSSQKNSMERWKYQGIGIDLDQEDDFGRISQHWTMQPFNYGNQYLGLLQVSLGRGAGTTNRVELMSSRDGRAWRYVARHSDFLSRGAAGHWDGTSELLAMILARVIGDVVATQKDASHKGRKILLVQPLDLDGNDRGDTVLALDAVDAGIGDRV